MPPFHVAGTLSNQWSWPKWLLPRCLRFKDFLGFYLAVSKPGSKAIVSSHCFFPHSSLAFLSSWAHSCAGTGNPWHSCHHRAAPDSPLFFFLLSLSLSFIIPLTLPSHLKRDLRPRLGSLVVIELSKTTGCQKQSVIME